LYARLLMLLLRILAALIAAASGLAVREIMQLSGGIGGLSAGSGLAAAVAGAAMLLAAAMVVAPRRWWERGLSPMAAVRQAIRAADVAAGRRAGGILIGIAGVTWALMLARHLSLPQNPWDDDQGAFLITAQEIHDSGGIPGLFGDLFSGRFEEANRHPLYLGLLSIRPTITFGTALSAAIGTAALVLLTVLLGRRRSWETAGVFAVLLATNSAFCRFSSTVVCDILMLLLGGLIWLIHLPGLDSTSTEDVQSPRPAPQESRLKIARRFATTGALLGLAWLTKGTGLVLLGGYLVWLMAASLRSVQRDRTQPETFGWSRGVRRGVGRTAYVLVAFAIIGSPLLIRNLRRFGSPFHNVNSLLLFADRYEELDEMLQAGVSTGDAALHWLATHDMGDVVRRELSGLIWELYIILRSLGPAPLDDARILVGLPLAILAALWMSARRAPADGLLLIWTMVCCAVFAWYVPIAAGERFILPLLVPLLATAAESIIRVVHAGAVRSDRFIVACGIWAAVWATAAWIWGVID
jgi:hypothetical protein